MYRVAQKQVLWFNLAEKLGQLSQLNKLHVIQEGLT